MSRPSVRAVVREPRDGTLAAVERQADDAVAASGSWHDALAAAYARGGVDWFWLVDGEVTPSPAALDELLAPLADVKGITPPVLLAGKVLGDDGHMHAASAPWPPLLDRANVIAAARKRLVLLRLARWGSLLVHRSAIERHGLPLREFADGADDLEWTARILREEGGYLVPRSTAARPGSPPRAPFSIGEVRGRARMVRGSGWVGHEALWFAFILIVDLVGWARRR